MMQSQKKTHLRPNAHVEFAMREEVNMMMVMMMTNPMIGVPYLLHICGLQYMQI